jgi:hypothetical protein
VPQSPAIFVLHGSAFNSRTAAGGPDLSPSVYQGDLVKRRGELKIRNRRRERDYLVSGPIKPLNDADPDVTPLAQRLTNATYDL